MDKRYKASVLDALGRLRRLSSSEKRGRMSAVESLCHFQSVLYNDAECLEMMVGTIFYPDEIDRLIKSIELTYSKELVDKLFHALAGDEDESQMSVAQEERLQALSKRFEKFLPNKQ